MSDKKGIVSIVTKEETEDSNSSSDSRQSSISVRELKGEDDGLLEDQTDDGTGPNPFANPTIAKYYYSLYESTKYECRHQFDPTFTWTKEEQKKLQHKLDLRVTFLACFMFASLNIDRYNLAQAVADNLMDDLGITNTQYNKGNTIFYLSFLCAELPSQLISKRLGPDRWIPVQMVLWSLVSLAQVRMGVTYFYVARCLLGLLQGGFIPDLVLWMSYFWTASELSIRLSFFWTMLSATKVVSSFIAYGLFHLRGVAGIEGWGWVFLVEGLITLVFGIASYFLMVPSAVQTKRPWNKHGWLSDREEKIVVNKILRDDPSKGDMHNRQGLSLRMLWNAITDFYLWPIYAIGIVAYIPTSTIGTYLTLVLEDLGYSTFQVNLLAIPSYVLEVILLLAVTWFSEKLQSIFYVALAQPIYQIPLMAVLRFWSGSGHNEWATYVIITLVIATPYIHAMMVSACSRNSQSVSSRTVSASLYNMFVQAGNIIASNVYKTADKPYYLKGNSVLFGCAVGILPLLLFAKWFYVTINKKREQQWRQMTPEQQDDYIATTNDVGSRRLDFRFAN